MRLTSNVPRADSIPEEWRTASHPHYEVSDQGRVRRAVPGHATRPGKILKAANRNKYLAVRFGERSCAVAHEVARAFLGPRPVGMQVNHKNGDKFDNRAANLEYVTPSRNALHAIEMGRWPMGTRQRQARLTPIGVRVIRRLDGVLTITEIARAFRISRCAIYRVLDGRSWKHVPLAAYSAAKGVS